MWCGGHGDDGHGGLVDCGAAAQGDYGQGGQGDDGQGGHIKCGAAAQGDDGHGGQGDDDQGGQGNGSQGGLFVCGATTQGDDGPGDQGDDGQGSINWRLRRHGVNEVMTRLGTVLFFVPLCSTCDRLNGKLLAARDRNNFKLVVQ